EPNQGTTICIYLPCFESVEIAEPRPTSSESAPPDGVETLLLVEDEDGLRALASHTLRQRGYHSGSVQRRGGARSQSPPCPANPSAAQRCGHAETGRSRPGRTPRHRTPRHQAP